MSDGKLAIINALLNMFRKIEQAKQVCYRCSIFSDGLGHHFLGILEFLDQMKSQGRPVFVHCQAGVGRTGTVLHLYYIAQGLTFKEADGMVRSKRIQCILLSDLQVEFLKEFAYLIKASKVK